MSDFKSPYQALQIACNMNKCQYTLLASGVTKHQVNHSWIFVSLNTIVDDWLKIYGAEDIDFSSLLSTNVAGELLDLICHYKRFYGNKMYPMARIYFFMYYTFDDLNYDVFGVQITRPSKYSKELREFMKSVTADMNVILNHVPGSYIVDTGNLPESVLPFSTIHNAMNFMVLNKLNHNSSVLICSKNPLDFTPMYMAYNANSINVSMYGFRRKQQELFTKTTFISNYIYKNRVKKPRPSACTYEMYLNILLSYASKFDIEGISDDTIKEAKRRVKLILGSEFVDDCNDDGILGSQVMYTAALAVVDIANVFASNSRILADRKVFWKIDKLDFSIEGVNETWFRDHRLDIQSLMLGVRV